MPTTLWTVGSTGSDSCRHSFGAQFMEKIFARAPTLATGSRQNISERLLAPQGFLQLTADEVLRASRYHRPLSVSLIQIDGLQTIRQNDGEETARTIFADTTARVIHAMRIPDRVGRLGLGQLGLLLPETTLKQALAASERLRETIEFSTVSTEMGERRVTISVGLATLSARMRDAQTFLMAACFELRRAQSEGANCVCAAGPDLAMVTVNRSGQVH